MRTRWSDPPTSQINQLSDTTYNEKWEEEKFTINARLKILTRLTLNRVNQAYFLFIFLVVSTSAIDCLERLVTEMT